MTLDLFRHEYNPESKSIQRASWFMYCYVFGTAFLASETICRTFCWKWKRLLQRIFECWRRCLFVSDTILPDQLLKDWRHVIDCLDDNGWHRFAMTTATTRIAMSIMTWPINFFLGTVKRDSRTEWKLILKIDFVISDPMRLCKTFWIGYIFYLNVLKFSRIKRIYKRIHSNNLKYYF